MRILSRNAVRSACALAIAATGLAQAAFAATPRQASATNDILTACALPDVEREARCGSIIVAEDRRKRDGRRIALRIAVLPALRAPAKKDPIVILLGGPGESAVEDAAVYARWLGPALHDRDLLLLDQRGAGGSAPLKCRLADEENPAALLKDTFPPEAVERCVAALSKRADLTRYGYLHFADDLEHVRKRLGYGRLNLFGGSYGTRAAQVYLRQFPKSVRTAFLGSVVPVDIATPITMARTAQTELDRLFEACTSDAACSHAYPQLRSEFDEIMRRLEAGEARLSIGNREDEFVLHSAPAVAWLRARLYRPSSAAILPWMIHRAYLGDWKPVADSVLASAGSSLSFGLFFAITCNEDVRFIDPEGIAESARGSFLRDTRVRQQQAACRFWPPSPLPRDYRDPVRSSVPTLFVTGEADGGTPVWFTDQAARHFSQSAIILAPGQGHTEWSPCISEQYFDLLKSGRIMKGRRTSCPSVPRPPFTL